jgi:hypothetical protein
VCIEAARMLLEQCGEALGQLAHLLGGTTGPQTEGRGDGAGGQHAIRQNHTAGAQDAAGTLSTQREDEEREQGGRRERG